LGALSGYKPLCHWRSLPPFAERDLCNIGLLKQSHFGLMPANLITLPHFSVSSAMSLPKAAGDLASINQAELDSMKEQSAQSEAGL
jgi:hypothetical protein